MSLGVSETAKAPRPAVRTRAGFHADPARRQCRHDRFEFVPPHRRALQFDFAVGMDDVQRKYVLGKIDAER